MAASFLIPLLFTMKMGGLLIYLRRSIRVMERARIERGNDA